MIIIIIIIHVIINVLQKSTKNRVYITEIINDIKIAVTSLFAISACTALIFPPIILNFITEKVYTFFFFLTFRPIHNLNFISTNNYSYFWVQCCNCIIKKWYCSCQEIIASVLEVRTSLSFLSLFHRLFYLAFSQRSFSFHFIQAMTTKQNRRFTQNAGTCILALFSRKSDEILVFNSCAFINLYQSPGPIAQFWVERTCSFWTQIFPGWSR